MKLKEDNIDIYNNSAIILNNKTPSIINSWIIILIIIFLLFIVFSFLPFNIYKTYSGYIEVKENETYINLIVNEIDFPINKNKKLYIKENQYKYSIENIEKNNILLKINLNDNIYINNSSIIVNILKDRTTLFNVIKNKLKKGFE